MITAAEIRPLFNKQIDIEWTNRLKLVLEGTRRDRDPLYLNKCELDQILDWKLGQQRGRISRYLDQNTDDLVRSVTALALTVSHSDKNYELELRVSVLCALRGIGVPVASAVLALVFPEQYAVIDFRGWRQVFGERRSDFSIADYRKYMREIRQLASELHWTPQEVDHAIWEHDRRSFLKR
jgi:hypothetical protein